MRIGIDARELLGKPTGVGRYLSNLLAEWAIHARTGTWRHDLLLYSPAQEASRALERIEGISSLGAAVRVAAGKPGTWWEQCQLPAAVRQDHVDVFFAPAYTSPLGVTQPIVQTIHDVSYMAHPEWFAPRERFRRSWLTRLSARRARTILTDSQFSALEIHRHAGVPEHRIRVIPLGVTPWPTDGSRGSDTGRAAAGWPSFREREPLVLFVGSVLNRRHVPELIRGFARVADTVAGARLEIVGENRSYPRQDLEAVCRAAGVRDRVSLRAYVSDEELVRLYRSARAFVFLSEYEGFGLTPLEALACDIPVLLLDTAVARETCGSAAQYVSDADPGEVAGRLVALLTDEQAHEAALGAAPAVLARYRWADTARATMLALEGAAS